MRITLREELPQLGPAIFNQLEGALLLARTVRSLVPMGRARDAVR